MESLWVLTLSPIVTCRYTVHTQAIVKTVTLVSRGFHHISSRFIFSSLWCWCLSCIKVAKYVNIIMRFTIVFVLWLICYELQLHICLPLHLTYNRRSTLVWSCSGRIIFAPLLPTSFQCYYHLQCKVILTLFHDRRYI